jgi:hypothetical protein
MNSLPPHIHFSTSVTFAIRGVHNTVVCEFPDGLRKEGRTSIVGVTAKPYDNLESKKALVVSVLRPVVHQLRSCLVDVTC